MNFSEHKRLLLHPQKEMKLSTFLIALLVAAAFFVPYMIMGEGYFIFYGDFNVQQIPFYQQCHQAVKSGNIFWSWTTDLGSNFIGSYSFYLLGSPYFWITLPFPNSFLPYLMGPLLILKFASAAFTAYLYIRRFTRTPDAARLGGLLYAFSGFSVYNIFFNHFHEAIIVFPLLLLSLELLITENRRFIFALTVCLCSIINYFFFFGMVVFTVIYYFVRVGSKAYSFKFSRFAVLVFEAVLGLLLSAFLLLPSYLAIADNYRIDNYLLGWSAIMYGKEQIYGNIMECFFFPPDIPARPVFFPGAEVKWSSLGGWLPLFSMVGVFAWFSQKRGTWLKRIIGICIFMALVPILNSAFYAFNTSYYARWFYMPILMMCLATVSLTENYKTEWGSAYKWVLGITIAATAVIGFFPQKNNDGELIFGLYSQGSDDEDKLMYFGRFWGACLIAIISLVILGLLIKVLKRDRKAFYRIALPVVCIISIIYANVFVASGRSHSYDIKEVMIDQLIEGNVDFEDESEFRIDVYDGVDNTSMYLGVPGINAFHSVVPASIFEFYDYVGVERSVGSRPETDVDAIRPLLSVKYLINRKNGDSFVDNDTHDTQMPGYYYLKSDGGYYIYQNENYIPYGFSYNYYMDYDFCDGYDENTRANMMLKAILLTDEQIEKYSYMMYNIETAPLYSDGIDNETSLSISDEAMAMDCENLRKTSAYYFVRDNRGFTAKVERENECLVFFSVPYDDGWSATVNGKPAEIEKVNAGFMAVKVNAGDSEIRFNYMTPGLLDGIKITTLSAAVLIIYIIAFTFFSKRNKTYTKYPEGDKLLKQWQAEELDETLLALQNEKKTNETTAPDSTEQPSEEIENLTNTFGGGFKINLDAFEETENKNTKEN